MKIKRANILAVMLTFGIAVSIGFPYIANTFYKSGLPAVGPMIIICTSTGIVISLFNYFLLRAIVSRLWRAQKNIREYKHKAYTDDLTGLLNRRAFDRDIETHFDRNGSQGVTMAFIDVDNFKMFNNQYGHPVGDRVLKDVAKEIRSGVRASDRVYRYGGEEFIIVFDNTDKRQGMYLAERIRKKVNELDLPTEGRISISIGVASCPEDAETIEELIRISDEALYCAKRNGKNVVSIFDKIAEKSLSRM